MVVVPLLIRKPEINDVPLNFGASKLAHLNLDRRKRQRAAALQRAPLYFWRRFANCFSVSRKTPSFSFSE